MYLSRSFICSVIPDVAWHGPDFKQPPHGVADSRMVAPGDIFIALKGQRDDGHRYLEQALERGAAGFIIEKCAYDAHRRFIERVQETHTVVALQDVQSSLASIARAWRNSFSIPVVGITGSVGKTSAKELLAIMVRAGGKKCMATKGNHNTLLGCALTLLQLTREHEVALIEMGINKSGEMERLADLVRPTVAIITRVGHGHLEGLGTCSSIAVEKRAIFTYFTPESLGIIPGDQPVVSSVSYAHQIIRFGKKTSNQVQFRKITFDGQVIRAVLKIYGNSYPVWIPTVQETYLNTVLVAAAAAHVLGIQHTTICRVVQEPHTISRRFEKHVIAQSRGIVIDDAYNANPESMKASLLAFERISGVAPKIAVLGDMLELGTHSAFWHRQLGRFLRKTPSITQVVLVGPHAALMQKTMPSALPSVCVPSWREAVILVNQIVQGLPREKKIAILLKASRGLAFHHMVHYLIECTTPTT